MPPDYRVAAACNAFEAAVRAVAPATAFGLVLRDRADQVAVLVRRHPGGRAQAFAASELPPALSRLDRVAQFLPDASPLDPARRLDALMAQSAHERLVAVPLADQGFFWTTADAGEPLAWEQLRAYESLGAQILRRAAEAETPEEALQQWGYLDRLSRHPWALAAEAPTDAVLSQTLAAAHDVLPHDQATVCGRAAGGTQWALGAPIQEGLLPRMAWEDGLRHVVVDDAASPADAAGTTGLAYRSALWVPIRRQDGVPEAALLFQSRVPRRFSGAELFIASHLAARAADALAYARLTEDTARIRRRAAIVERIDKLLVPLATTGSVKDVFDQLSSIAGEVIRHDALMLPIRVGDGRLAKLHATSGFGDAVPDTIPVPAHLVEHPDWDYDIEGDIQARPLQRHTIGAQRGYRSMLRLSVQLDGEFAGALVFLSRTPSLYTEDDLPVARRMTDRLTLAFSRERREAAVRRADETDERAMRLESRVRDLSGELDARTGVGRVVGVSPQWRHALTEATQVAETSSTVLLLGESGTGKELMARFVHRASARATGPFVAINCATLPEHLLEAELFGYERGAFTGALHAKPGQIEQASGGTVFLDEVAEMNLVSQAKVLRVLQEREFQRLGGTRRLTTDARVVAATNRDLEAAMARGQFREDLYYRLNVFSIRLPPLRDRVEDIMPLAEAFLEDLGRTFARPPAGVSREACSMLLEYSWPGNVRELRNVLERAAILCGGGLITSDHLALRTSPRPAAKDDPGTAEAPPPPREPDSLPSVERSMIEQALREARFNKSRAAKALGLTRAQLYVRLRRHGLE